MIFEFNFYFKLIFAFQPFGISKTKDYSSFKNSNNCPICFVMFMFHLLKMFITLSCPDAQVSICADVTGTCSGYGKQADLYHSFNAFISSIASMRSLFAFPDHGCHHCCFSFCCCPSPAHAFEVFRISDCSINSYVCKVYSCYPLSDVHAVLSPCVCTTIWLSLLLIHVSLFHWALLTKHKYKIRKLLGISKQY